MKNIEGIKEFYKKTINKNPSYRGIVKDEFLDNLPNTEKERGEN